MQQAVGAGKGLQRSRGKGPQDLFPFWTLRRYLITCGTPQSKGTVKRPKSIDLLTLITNNYMAGYLLR